MSRTARPARLGPKMREVVLYVARHPGCNKAKACHASGLYGTNYQPIERAIAAGLLRAERHGARYALFVSCPRHKGDGCETDREMAAACVLSFL